ncbi:YfdX family protein [Citrobacter sp. JGM124]|uniref:YfdX family protein n=1 Tax=Citrobacter sp. JGM124 TaxID=2799789 RepID=UPI001BA9929A|nr:YfdX family protein [Citrobacter sp. JGM124]MBS0849377.1 YfdX family protein [Citrobacter sp. JGM124]
MRRLFSAVMITAALSTVPFLVSAQETSTVAQQQAAETLKISEQGFTAVQDVRLARLAIFQGVPEHAVKLTENAAKLLTDDSIDWKKFATTNKNAALIGDQYIAIDGTVGISENFISTPEKQAAIKKANEQLSQGDKKSAMETLRLADISVTQKLYLLPLKHSQIAVAEAQNLLKEKKYYEANLALKAIEDSVLVDNTGIVAE